DRCVRRAHLALAYSPERLAQLLGKGPAAQNSASRRNSLLPGTPERQAQKAPRLATTAEDVTRADHIIALAIGLAFCMEACSVCTPKKGRCSNNHRSPAGQPSGLPVPPTV